MKKVFALLLAVLLTTPALQVNAVIPDTAAQEIERSQKVIADAAAMEFPTDDTNVTQLCPVCGKVVEWLAWSLDSAANLESTSSHNLIDKHLFLIGDMAGIEDIYDQTINWDGFVFTASTKNTHSVIHLNGHTIKGPQGGIRARGGDLSIIGSGEVWGNRNNSKYGGNLDARETGVLNIYGGTYYKTSPQPLLQIGGAEAAVNLYGGKLEGNDNKAEGTVVVEEGGTFNVYGGSVESGYTSKDGDTLLVNAGCSANIYGGKVAGGKDEAGGNIYTAGDLQISGGEISGAIKEYGGKLQITGGYVNSVVVSENCVIEGGTFTTDITRFVAEGVKVSNKDGVYTVGAAGLAAPGELPWLWIGIGGAAVVAAVLVTVLAISAKKKKETE